MKTFVYKPADLDGVSGEIELRVPGFADRCDFVELFAQDQDKKELVGVEKVIDDTRSARKIVKWSEAFYQRVAISIDGEAHSSFDDLSANADAADLLVLVANALAEKVSMSKKKQRALSSKQPGGSTESQSSMSQQV